MREVPVKLNSAKTINAFLNIVSRFDDILLLKSGRYMVNARSPIGLFNCDLSKPIRLLIYSNEEKILPALSGYMRV